jgi:hypothetical protein
VPSFQNLPHLDVLPVVLSAKAIDPEPIVNIILYPTPLNVPYPKRFQIVEKVKVISDVRCYKLGLKRRKVAYKFEVFVNSVMLDFPIHRAANKT